MDFYFKIADNAAFVSKGHVVDIEVSGQTNIGAVREENEDSLGILKLPDGYFLTVCDGMGGYAGGRIASETAVETLLAYVKEHYVPDSDTLPDLLREAVNAANEAVRTKAKADSRLGEMGTTCVATIVSGDHYFVGHVGDSRAYHLGDAVFTLRTEDHTVVQQLVNLGQLDALEATNHPSAGILVRCLGQLDKVVTDVSGPYPLRDGDRLLLCSDGLSGMLYEDDIARVYTGLKLEDAIADLLKYAVEAGGFDNITAVGLQAGAWPTESPFWDIHVDTPEGKALVAAESGRSSFPAVDGQPGATRNTLVMQAITVDDTRELDLRASRRTPSEQKRHNPLVTLGLIVLVAVALAGLIVFALSE